MLAHDEWAEREWQRLEALGKIQFFPNFERPSSLNVNPCALILKERSGSPEHASVWERYKARLIMDRRRGRVKERLPSVEVHYGTVDLAVSQMHVGNLLFVIDVVDCFFN